MNKYDVFFDKVVSDEVLVKCLSSLRSEVWSNMSFKDRKNTFVMIVNKMSEFYPSLGKPKFDFVVLEDSQSGEDSEEGTFLNVKMLEDGNHFEVLATFIHEMRHYYQRVACSLFEKEGVIHGMFTKEEIEFFSENLARSAFMSVDNYIESNEINDLEYKLQPIEYDAEDFSYEFMKRFSSRFIKSKLDLMNCEIANLGFDKIKKLHDGNDKDIINFNKIPIYNYTDYVKDNRVTIKKEEEKYKKYLSLLDKLYFLNDKQIFILLNPGFLLRCDSDTVMNLLNAYLEFNESSTRIVKEGNEYYYNGLLFDIKETLTYKLIEPLFLQVANERVEKISEKNLDEITNCVERDVKINLMSRNNFIEERKNPLLYRLQPCILYRDMFIKDEYFKLISAIDKPYDDCYCFFCDFVMYVKKYDYTQIIKKAEILFDKKFEDIYEEMLGKMKLNINKERKTK